jgi:hypothetical protein
MTRARRPRTAPVGSATATLAVAAMTAALTAAADIIAALCLGLASPAGVAAAALADALACAAVALAVAGYIAGYPACPRTTAAPGCPRGQPRDNAAPVPGSTTPSMSTTGPGGNARSSARPHPAPAPDSTQTTGHRATTGAPRERAGTHPAMIPPCEALDAAPARADNEAR